jgi:hypothetical protein
VAAIIYVVVHRSFDLQGEQLLIEAADAGLESAEQPTDYKVRIRFNSPVGYRRSERARSRPGVVR